MPRVRGIENNPIGRTAAGGVFILLDCAPRIGGHFGDDSMGKGDRKTRRGKIYNGSYGKTRAKDPAKRRKKLKKAAAKR